MMADVHKIASHAIEIDFNGRGLNIHNPPSIFVICCIIFDKLMRACYKADVETNYSITLVIKTRYPFSLLNHRPSHLP
jgi:hypothetical protein